MPKQSKRSSPMENGEHSGNSCKKVRPPQQAIFVGPHGEMKKEREEEEEEQMSHGDEGAGALLPSSSQVVMEKLRVSLDMESPELHCSACRRPLKPPMFEFECQAEHVVCFSCRGDGYHCPACNDAATYRRCGRLLEAIIGAAKVLCPYEEHGCKSYLAHYEVADHQLVCPCAPCCCPEPGCGFTAPPANLLDHFAAAAHSWPVSPVRYGRPTRLTVLTTQRWHVLVAQEDRCLFLLSLHTLGATTTFSLVCVRAYGSAAVAPKITGKLWVEVPHNVDDTAMITLKVRSSDMSGRFAPALQGMWLVVPPDLVRGDDAGESGEAIHLCVRIDKRRSATPAA